ncbi:DsbA family protein [Candidatus Binatia bacterium]|nr:DsbA family protein [Candidatus Binatia bacterium]
MADGSALARRLSPYVVGTLTSPRTRQLRRWLAEQRRRMRGEPQRVHYFHQVDDPYSQLVVQVLPQLVARYDVELVPHLVGPPPDSAAPDRERLVAFARRDAADVAPGYGVAFPIGAAVPPPESVLLATRALAAAIAAGSFVSVAAGIGDALWSGDRERLRAVTEGTGLAEPGAAAARVADGTRVRERLGHYLGGTLFFGSEWFWGVDRLDHLERRLRALGLQRDPAHAAFLAPRPDPSHEPVPAFAPSARVALEFYPSLRSPYTAIVMDRVRDLTRRLPVDLVLRPVLPMVMRGLAVPRVKRLYITLDTKREAEDAGIEFGRVSDPVGRPVERAFSLYPWACSEGRGFELLRSFTRAAFAEGIDTGSDDGLRRVVENAGLSWSDARAHLDREGWRDELEANRQQMLALGLWGVPSFRIVGAGGEPDYATWGQDRLWRVEQEVRRRLGGHVAPAARSHMVTPQEGRS